MSELKDLLSILKCPMSGSELEIESGQLKSKKTGLTYLNIDEIPWLFANPALSLMEWQNKIRNLTNYYEQKALSLEDELRDPLQLSSTKVRLNSLKEGYSESAANIQLLTEELLGAGPRNEELDQAFFEKLPRNQTVGAYYLNLFRDWAWGKDENKKGLDFIFELIGEPKGQLGKLLCLGAGSCGLPYLLHKELQPELSIALDINPVLLLTAKLLHDGGEIELYEFPQVPVDSRHCSILHNLTLGERPQENFHFLFADGLNLPFQEKSMNTVFTPWFIDVVPQDFRSLCQSINSTLDENGLWINFGQMGFDFSSSSLNYSVDEVQQALKEAGFELVSWKQARLPYLQSPHDAYWREDMVFGFLAKKITHHSSPSRFHHYPEWLSHFDTPIPAEPIIMNIGIKSKVYGDLLGQVNGHKSLNDLIDFLQKDYSMGKSQARELVTNLFINIYEGYIFRDL